MLYYALPAPRRTLLVGTVLIMHIPLNTFPQNLVCVLLVLIQPHFPLFFSSRKYEEMR